KAKNIPSNKPVKKETTTKKSDNEDTIGNLINDINNGKTSQRTKQKANTTNNKAYKVQMGSYKTQQEANKQKARLIMMDIPSTVVKANVNGQDYYRVVTAQPVSKEKANQIKSNLKNKNIDSLIISQ
ncbi:MAG: SPOR domain-containing protein, partial [Neisseriaceae bacterium]|nr:SPOR domain-containing protein [Neisseriaceae bacterium]